MSLQLRVINLCICILLRNRHHHSESPNLIKIVAKYTPFVTHQDGGTQIFSSLAFCTKGLFCFNNSLPKWAWSYSQAWSSGILCLLQKVKSHLHLIPNKLTFFLQFQHLEWSSYLGLEGTSGTISTGFSSIMGSWIY